MCTEKGAGLGAVVRTNAHHTEQIHTYKHRQNRINKTKSHTLTTNNEHTDLVTL